jgi:hypothetical protein
MATVMGGSDVMGGTTAFQNGTGSAESSGFADKSKEKAKQLTGMAREKAVGQLDTAKGQLTGILGSVADGLEKAGREAEGPAAKAFDMAAQFVRTANDRVSSGNAEDLLAEAQTQLRNRPGLALAGLVGIGFLAGRLIKS